MLLQCHMNESKFCGLGRPDILLTVGLFEGCIAQARAWVVAGWVCCAGRPLACLTDAGVYFMLM
jgi:hypothetical protein